MFLLFSCFSSVDFQRILKETFKTELNIFFSSYESTNVMVICVNVGFGWVLVMFPTVFGSCLWFLIDYSLIVMLTCHSFH